MKLAYRCKACSYRLAMDAYYCKECGALVDLAQAPENRVIDRSFRTRFNQWLEMSLFSKLGWGALIVIAGYSAFLFFNNLHHSEIDNGSSKVFLMRVDSAYSPFSCSGTFCHVVISVENKTDQTQTLTGDPYLQRVDGKLFGPTDPRLSTGQVIYFGDIYCRKDLNIVLKPHQVATYLGVCAYGLQRGELISKVLIFDKNKKLVVSNDLKVAIPLT